jgi:hypothetical protein
MATAAVFGFATAALVAGKLGGASEPPPQGLAAGVSALDRANEAPLAPTREMRLFARYNARSLGVGEAQVLSRFRLLRKDLGPSRRAVYALRIDGTVCFLLTGEGGTCSSTDGTSSFTWTIGGGDGVTDAGALVGIAADDVAGIDLYVDRAPVRVSLLDNVAYADLPLSGRTAEIIVRHDDGRATTDTVMLGG